MDKQEIKHFSDLQTWQEGHKFVLEMYKLTDAFPKKEQFGIISQLQRAAVSITANIAEGFSRYHFKDKIRFYYMSRGSVSEVQNLLLISKDVGYIKSEIFDKYFEQSTRIQSLINGLIRSINQQEK